MKEVIHESSGNVFVDLGFAPEQAVLMRLRADLMEALRKTIEEREWTQQRAATELGVTQSRVSDLIRGKWDKFSIDMLVSLAVRAGLQPTVTI
ncbi:MAG TPA: XRE family transcriptional regulator [Pararobbsia sp.]|nr:XRE family transcriptional regulator [Pararobbsia sp.]